MRRLQPKDAAALAALVQALAPEERRRRWGNRSPLTAAPARAALLAPGLHFGAFADDGTLVGHAELRLPHGKETSALPGAVPDVGLAVHPGRRHQGLGRHLLRYLLAAASTRGFEQVGAMVDTDNRAALALLSAVPLAVADQEDPATAVLLVATGQAPPAWPSDSAHPRILVEGGGLLGCPELPGLRGRPGSLLRCRGPRTAQDCPLVRGGSCPLVEGSDMVLLSRALGPLARPLAEAHRRTGRPGHPLLSAAPVPGFPDPPNRGTA
jgi:ribosomal protein S18 acetylase RimI-like enzyme